MINKQFMAKRQLFGINSAFLMILVMVVFTALVAASASSLADTTRPTIISTSPANNERDVQRNEQIAVVFSEDMDPSTINRNTVVVMQRTTPALGGFRSISIDETVTYAGRTAIFNPNELFSPNQQYGNVFTVEMTTGVKDIAGNSLSQNYVWSFTTGEDSFNTGATTSQVGQTPAPIGGTAAAPILAEPAQPPFAAAPPVADAPVATADSFPSALILIIGGLLLLMALILALAKKSAHQKNSQAAHLSPFGDVHPVIDIEGIGPEYNRGLLAMGIKDTEQLWNANAAKVAQETGAPVSSVKSWQHMAELASVKDIGPQYAELLERSGIHSIDQLKSYNPNKLLSLVRKKQNTLEINIQGNFPGHATVEHWIGKARGHKFSGSRGQAV